MTTASGTTKVNHAAAPLPCPYCRADAVRLVARGATFLHYHCASCNEGWTALSAMPSPAARPRGVSPRATITLLAGVPPPIR